MRRALPWILAAPWVAWALGRTVGVDRAVPWLAAGIAFTPYAAVTAVVPLVVALVLRAWRPAIVCALTLVLFALAVLPRALGDAPDAGDRTITVMASNLWLGSARTAQVLDIARREDVDVLVLVELSNDAWSRLRAAGLERTFPHAMVESRLGGTGSAIFSRHPLTPFERTVTAKVTQPTADVRTPHGTVRVQAVHPPPPIGRERSELWRELLGGLPAGGRTDVPSVLAGDFNATLDHRALRRILGEGYTDAADALGAGLQPTWPVGRRGLPLTIDHVLSTDALVPVAYRTREISGSDHRAVIARLALR